MTGPAGPDPYVDPASGVLRNLLGIADAGELAQVEAALSASRLIDLERRRLPGSYNLDHLRLTGEHCAADLRLQAQRRHDLIRGARSRSREDHRRCVLSPAPAPEFLRFLKKVAAGRPGVQLHIVADNYATHKYPEIRAWLAQPENHRITLHFTPTGCPRLNKVGIFFGIITRQAIRRGTLGSVKDLTAAIGKFIDACNDRCQPFAWTKDDELFAKVRASRTNAT